MQLCLSLMCSATSSSRKNLLARSSNDSFDDLAKRFFREDEVALHINDKQSCMFGIESQWALLLDSDELADLVVGTHAVFQRNLRGHGNCGWNSRPRNCVKQGIRQVRAASCALG